MAEAEVSVSSEDTEVTEEVVEEPKVETKVSKKFSAKATRGTLDRR